MGKKWLGYLICLGIGLVLVLLVRSLSVVSTPIPVPIPTLPSSSVPPSSTVQYHRHRLPTADVYTVVIPTSFHLIPAISSDVAFLEQFVQTEGGVAAINGGFFDPVNQKSTSYITQAGQLVADPRQNERLMDNPDLIAYLDQILNRSEIRRYDCPSPPLADETITAPSIQSTPIQSTIRYAIARHTDPVPPVCRLIDALGAGPQLLPELTLAPEAFLEVRNNGVVSRDALGSRQPNARSAIGLMADGQVVLAMAAQRPDAPTSSGLSLPEMAAFMKTLGVEQALNLDGGSSSALYYDGTVIHGKVDAQGRPVQRPVKSVLLVMPRS